jgi:hypothetical protein
MNRIEIIATFSALKELCRNKNYDSVEHVIDEVLDEARRESKKEEKEGHPQSL